jgi:hypothetical protein
MQVVEWRPLVSAAKKQASFATYRASTFRPSTFRPSTLRLIQPMPTAARISILQGPDEGKTFAVEDELVQLGRGNENAIALSDDALQAHQASIIRRNGRYAIFTPIDQGVEVDGNHIPAEQWVWLPESANIRLGQATLIQFQYQLDAASPPDEPSPPSPSKAPPESRPSRPRTPPQRRQKSPPARQLRKVAKFLTDTSSGDQLVRLGEDGKLPELALVESDKPARAERRKGDKPPVLLYVAVGFSMLLSVAMLLFNFDSTGATESQRAEARKTIEKYYGTEGKLRPYQRLLREARRARAAGNRAAETAAYKRVLDLLNSEDVANSYTGLTGDRKGDDELRRLIGILMER